MATVLETIPVSICSASILAFIAILARPEPNAESLIIYPFVVVHLIIQAILTSLVNRKKDQSVKRTVIVLICWPALIINARILALSCNPAAIHQNAKSFRRPRFERWFVYVLVDTWAAAAELVDPRNRFWRLNVLAIATVLQKSPVLTRCARILVPAAPMRSVALQITNQFALVFWDTMEILTWLALKVRLCFCH